MKREDLKELRVGTIIYNDYETLKCVDTHSKNNSYYTFDTLVFESEADIDGSFTGANLRRLTPNEVLKYSFNNYYEIECWRNDYKRNFDKYGAEALRYILDTLIGYKYSLDIAVAEYLTKKYPHMAEYQINEIVSEAIYQYEEEKEV